MSMDKMAKMCDFCSSLEPEFCYDAKTFVAWETGTFTGESVGGWAACKPCKIFVDLGDKVRLAERITATFIESTPEFQILDGAALAELRGQFDNIVELFFANRV